MSMTSYMACHGRNSEEWRIEERGGEGEDSEEVKKGRGIRVKEEA